MEIPENRGSWRPNLWWKDPRRRNRTNAGLREDDITNRETWRPQMTGQAKDKDEAQPKNVSVFKFDDRDRLRFMVWED